jgi:hypothetical protein
MKALGAICGLLIVGVAAYLLLRPVAPSAVRAAQSGGGQQSGNGTYLRSPDQAIHAPLTHEDEIREELGNKRLPFYRLLREKFGEQIQHFGVTEQLDTLDLQVASGDDETIKYILENAVTPTAKQYGFKKVRFYIANPPSSSEPMTLVAESTDDGSGQWTTFKK